jgi:hypothetical protein
MKRSLALLVLSVAAALAVVVSGCGATSSVTGGDALAKAAAATTSAHGSKVAMTITLSSNGLPQPIHMTASGVMDNISRQGRINVDMSDLLNATGNGSGLKASQLQATEILNGTVIYMRLPLFDGKLPGNKRWVKLDIAKAGKALGINLGPLSPTGQDPSQQIGYLRTVSDAKKVGTDTIRGVTTTHYRGVAKLDRYPDLLPASQRASARAAVQRLIKVIGTNSMPIDAWVDGGNRIRRVKVTMNTKVAQTSQSLRMDIQEDLYDFGTQVVATPPPAGQVFDATSAASNAIKSSGLGG